MLCLFQDDNDVEVVDPNDEDENDTKTIEEDAIELPKSGVSII